MKCIYAIKYKYHNRILLSFLVKTETNKDNGFLLRHFLSRNFLRTNFSTFSDSRYSFKKLTYDKLNITVLKNLSAILLLTKGTHVLRDSSAGDF